MFTAAMSMTRDEIYRMHGVTSGKVDAARKEVAATTPEQEDMFGVRGADDALAHIEAVAVGYRSQLERGRLIDGGGGLDTIIKMVKYIRDNNVS